MLEVISGAARRRDLTIDCDVAIVGSGAGGATVAAYLAEAGRDVVVLEEGPHLPAREHGALRPTESLRRVWRDAGATFAIGLGKTPEINVTAGRGVGGSSALTGGVCFRARDHVLEAWAQEGMPELAPEPMAPWYSRVERDVRVAEVPALLRSKSTRLFAEGGERLGIPFHSMRRNVVLGPTAHDAGETPGCRGCGRCNFGCPHVAKMSVDIAYLPRAVRAGARIVSDCLALRLELSGDRATGVHGRLASGAAAFVRAKDVVVAAGAMYTPSLLGASGLGVRSGALGRNLTLHPSFRVLARFDEPVRGWEGALQSAYSDHFDEDGMILNSVFVPNGVMVATMPGFGERHERWRRDVANLAIFGGMIHDDGGGRVWRNPFGREPVMTYRMSDRDRARVPMLLRRMTEIFFAAGATHVVLPVLGGEPLEPDDVASYPWERIPMKRLECSSQHPLGTCHMGPSPRTSVVDPDGRAWDAPNVWVADGSLLPTSLGVNPQLTIMAMAARVAFKMIEARPRTSTRAR